jgi:glucan phosphoethanolaminetransferase (alkaline phosphatase superfamily)
LTSREFIKEQSMKITFIISLIITIILRYTIVLEKGNKLLAIFLIIFLANFIIIKLIYKLFIKLNVLGNVLEEKRKRNYMRLLIGSYFLICVFCILGK